MIHVGKKELTRHSTYSLKRFIVMDACGANAVECSLRVLSLDVHQCKLHNRESVETYVTFLIVLFRFDTFDSFLYLNYTALEIFY